MPWKEDFKKGLLPNSITLLGLIFAMSSLFFLKQSPLAALIQFIIAWQFDFWDGWLARKLDAESQIGSFWDPLADKIITWSFLIYFWDKIHLLISIVIIIIGFGLTVLRIFKLNYHKKTQRGFSIMAKAAGKIKTNIERTAFCFFILCLTLIKFNFNIIISLYTIIVIFNYILAISAIFAGISLINQINDIV